MNKFAIALTLYAATTYAQEVIEDGEIVLVPSSECLYCRRMDQNSGFLVSYSYCEQSDECLMDAWNYINRDCSSGWESGNNYDLDLCNPEIVTCLEPYVSTPDKYGSYQNTTWTLPQGASCDIIVDASQGVGRVIFDETSFLGIDNVDAKLGEVITFESGAENVITIYNAAQTGPLTFLIAFSGAAQLGAAVATLMLAASTL